MKLGMVAFILFVEANFKDHWFTKAEKNNNNFINFKISFLYKFNSFP